MRRSSSRAGMTCWTSLAQDYASLSIEEAQHRDVAHSTNWTLRVNSGLEKGKELACFNAREGRGGDTLHVTCPARFC